MKEMAWMVAASVGSWMAATIILGRRTSLDVLLGMIGPLLMATLSWVLVARTHRRNPAGVTGVMAMSFFVKMLFFAAYVVIMLRVVSVQPVPFVISFTSYFIALFLMDWVFLRRLFSGRSD